MAGALPFRSWKALGGSAAFELRGLPAPAGGNGVESRLRVGFSYIFLTCTSSWETKGVSQQSCAFFFHLLYVFVDSASGMSPVWHCADLDDPQSWTHKLQLFHHRQDGFYYEALQGGMGRIVQASPVGEKMPVAGLQWGLVGVLLAGDAV